MDDSNVNNLNGVPNFGHGTPEVSENEEVVTDASSPEGVEVVEVPEVVTESPADESEVEPMPETPMESEVLPEDN